MQRWKSQITLIVNGMAWLDSTHQRGAEQSSSAAMLSYSLGFIVHPIVIQLCDADTDLSVLSLGSISIA